jgi:hypothetical protein
MYGNDVPMDGCAMKAGSCIPSYLLEWNHIANPKRSAFSWSRDSSTAASGGLGQRHCRGGGRAAR